MFVLSLFVVPAVQAATPIKQSNVVTITGGYSETTTTQQYRKIGTELQEVYVGTRTERVLVGYETRRYWVCLYPEEEGHGCSLGGNWVTEQIPIYETRTYPVYDSRYVDVWGYVNLSTTRWVPVVIR